MIAPVILTPNSTLSAITTTVSATIAGVPLTSDSLSALHVVIPDAGQPLTADSKLFTYNTVLSSWEETRQDGISNALTIIDYEHHEVHASNSFAIGWNVGDVNAAASAILMVETSASTKWAHMVWEATTEAETTLRVWEGASYAASGTLVTPLNRNRNSALSATTFCHHTPTTPATGGTLITNRHWGSGKDGGTDRGAYEVILSAGTKYMMVFTNDSAQAAWMTMQLNFYEHTNVT